MLRLPICAGSKPRGLVIGRSFLVATAPPIIRHLSNEGIASRAKSVRASTHALHCRRWWNCAPGGRAEIVFFLGEAASAEEARTLIALYRGADLDELLRAVTKYWDDILGTVQVKTPDRAMNFMLNRWLLYQTLACRVWSRSAFYQAGGAYGFRDQLQDVMALAGCATRHRAGAVTARRRASIRRGRCAALVASSIGPRRAHPDLR